MKAMQLAIYLAIRYNEPDIVNILIKTIDVNIPLETGTTLLEEAVRFRRPAIIGHLLDAGAIKTQALVDSWILSGNKDISNGKYVKEHIQINKLFFDAPTASIEQPVYYETYRSISSPF
jgi:hypothetical protein